MDKGIVGPISPKLQVPEIGTVGRPGAEKKDTNFGTVLKDAISTVNELQKQSDREIEKLMTGESQDLHNTVIAMQKAGLSFQMMMQVRNKIVQAYQEIIRMQV
ncbi:MAG: flagellar hook-basal body complex protein FliE [Acidobacteria bacterium]|nr:flagellar hook-basal body complex protein FliE [Acidobacteriota bacterium]